jgi:hypothetical protein
VNEFRPPSRGGCWAAGTGACCWWPWARCWARPWRPWPRSRPPRRCRSAYGSRSCAARQPPDGLGTAGCRWPSRSRSFCAGSVPHRSPKFLSAETSGTTLRNGVRPASGGQLRRGQAAGMPHLGRSSMPGSSAGGFPPGAGCSTATPITDLPPARRWAFMPGGRLGARSQAGGEDVTDAGDQHGHLVGDHAHVTRGGGQHGQAGAVADRRDEQEPRLHLHNGLLDEPTIKAAGPTLAGWPDRRRWRRAGRPWSAPGGRTPRSAARRPRRPSRGHPPRWSWRSCR